jgi:hypothetical protein
MMSVPKAEAAGLGRYLPCDVCKGRTSHHRDCSVPVLGPPRCTCNPAEVEQGVCVLCGNPFPVGGAV